MLDLDFGELFREIKWRGNYGIMDWMGGPKPMSERRSNPYDVLREMKAAQWVDERSLNERILTKLRNIVRHAYEHVPYYNRLYRALGLQPNQVSNLDQFEGFPTTTKSELRKAGEDVLADNIDRTRMSCYATSGSTDDPFTYYLDSNWFPRRIASKWLLDSYFGARPQTRYFTITVFPPVKRSSHRRTFREKLRLALGISEPLQEYAFSYVEVTKEKIPDIAERLIRFGPKFGYGSPTALSILAEVLEDHSIRFPRLHAIVSSIEVLLDSERRRIEQAFGCPVFDRYGSRELYGAVAGECERHSGMHVNSELVLVEILDDDDEPCSSGEVGNIVITDFHNRSMPFIRFKIGDIGSINGGCDCGRMFPILKGLVGRAGEWIENKAGKKIPVNSLANFATPFPELAQHIRRFQYEETAQGCLTMRVLPEHNYNITLVKKILTEIGRLNAIDFEFEIVEQLSTYPSGKRRLLMGRKSTTPITDHYGHLHTLLRLYDRRPDLQAAFPEARGDLPRLQRLIEWVTVAGATIDGARYELEPYLPQFVLLKVYCSRPDLQQVMPAALGYPRFQSLINWAARWGISTDPAKTFLEPHAAWYEEHKTE
jgi:phenylacetate-CoA ligase